MRRSTVSMPQGESPSGRPVTELGRTKLGEVIPPVGGIVAGPEPEPEDGSLYVDTARLLLAFLLTNRLPTTVGDITREHMELLIADQLDRWTPGTAAVRFRSLKPLFTWLVERGAIAPSPMEYMRSPRIPDHPVPVAGTRNSLLFSPPVAAPASKMSETSLCSAS